jgi:hypothetical protein
MSKVVFVVLIFLHAVLLSLLIPPQVVLAQWTNDPTINTPIKTDPGDQIGPQIVTDEKGGAIIAWSEGGSLWGQRVDQDGYLLWDSAGEPVCTVSGVWGPMMSGMISDGEGGAIVVWLDFRNSNLDSFGFPIDNQIYTQKIDSTGQGVWALNGVPLVSLIDSVGRTEVGVTTDGAGGAIVCWTSSYLGMWDVLVQRVDSNGNTQWQINGIVVNDSLGEGDSPIITTDMTGGAIISYFSSTGPGRNLAQRVDTSGNRLWPVDSIILPRTARTHQIISDGIGGAVIVGVRGIDYNILAERINGNGQILWDTVGVVASTTSDDRSFPTITNDMNSGVIIVWSHEIFDFGNVHAQRVDSSGVPLWGSDGVVICDDSAAQVRRVPVTDGSGGAMISSPRG